MRGFIDLHCHWVAAIDDGVKTVAAGLELLQKLHQAGFSEVVATPHMRPGLFPNDRGMLRGAFDTMLSAIAEARPRVALPRVHLASEHWFDDVVFQRLTRGEGLPYAPYEPADASTADPGPHDTATRAEAPLRSVLVEFPPQAFPHAVQHRFFDLRRCRLAPVLAHPERYQPVQADDACLDPLLDAGAHLLLDLCSLVGKYGRAAQRAAEKLLEEDAYEAACSDAHRPEDVDAVLRALEQLERRVDPPEFERLLIAGPRAILYGTNPPG